MIEELIEEYTRQHSCSDVGLEYTDSGRHQDGYGDWSYADWSYADWSYADWSYQDWSYRESSN